MSAPTVDAALRDSLQMHVFLSGGGLRVVRLERHEPGIEPELLGYGEGPVLEDALLFAAEDYAAGGRAKRVSVYLTGQSAPSSEADAWVRRGRAIDAQNFGETIAVWLRGLSFHGFPESVVEEARVTKKVVPYVQHGVHMHCEPNADDSCTGYATGLKGYREQFISVDIAKFGSGPDFASALAKALKSEEVERP